MRITPRSMRSWRSAVLYGILVLTLASVTQATERSGTLALTFQDRKLTVTGAVPGHRIITVGLGIGRHGRAALLTRHVEALRDDDLDGSVTFTPHSLPVRSVWVAVDFENGDSIVATPNGEVPNALVLPDDAWRGSRAHVDVSRRFLEVLVVRAGVGAWNVTMADGGSRDADQESNGVSRVRLETMDRLLGEDKGPPFAIPRDLIVIIDPQTLELFVSEAR